jgi:phenylalanyl-tRNA synthetase beta chain
LKKLGQLELPYVEVVNPVVEKERRVRRGVVPSLLSLLEKNRRLVDDVRLFEIGKGYLAEERNERGEPREVHELGLVWSAPAPGKQARFDAGCLARLQGVVEDLLRSAGYPSPEWKRAKGGLPSWVHPGRALRALLPGADGEPRQVALLAELEPGLHKPLGLVAELAGEVAAAAVSLDALLDCPLAPLGFRPIPRFPGTKVDVALAVPESVRAGDVRALIEKAGKGLVASCELFDLYRGESLGADKKSLAWHVLLQSDQRTLGEEDGRKFLERVERAAGSLGGELRRE